MATRSCCLPVFLFLSLLLLISRPVNAQETLNDYEEVNRYGAWLLPSTANNIYGLALGPVGSEVLG